MHSITIGFTVHTLPFWFLIVSLFIPRISLLVLWLQHQLQLTGLLSLIGAVLVPRLLILLLIYQDQGLSGWFLIHVIALFAAWGGGGSQWNRRRNQT